MTQISGTDIEVGTQDAVQTRKLGERLGKVFIKDTVVYISGNLGAGKSTFAQGLIGGIGVTHPVVSPTFSLVEIYPIATGTICHIDLFRSTYAHEWLDAGIDETIASCCLTLIEWPDRGEMLPVADIRVNIADVSETLRTIKLTECTERGGEWLRAASF